jgi:hypothetical protein
MAFSTEKAAYALHGDDQALPREFARPKLCRLLQCV